MKSQFKSIVFLLLFPALLMATDGKYKYTKKKTINKEFTVNANAMLEVDNSFGNVDIVTWNENRIVIEVRIETHGNSEEKTQKRLDAIDVNFSATQSLVSAKTIFNKNGKKNWFGNNNNTSMEINYTIKMPVSNSLDLSNDYGSINLNRLEGHAKISCDYGQMIIGELMADNNLLNFDYTSKTTIGYMKSGKINADYSDFTLDKVGKLDLNADYTNSKITEVSNINYNCDYGKITIEKVGSLLGRGDYISHKIGTISGDLNINADYGSIKIEHLTPTVNNVIIKADYTGIKIGYDSQLNFNFSIDMKYASLNGKSDLIVQHSDKRNSSEKLSGFYGSENSGNNININSEYGGVTLTKQ
ncbi:MAG: hypothetical protein COB12_08380 [Flavobacterium sp.]|nr:MAG: hypothetical protein COB12_08380 [Flavobacterium sp.]